MPKSVLKKARKSRRKHGLPSSEGRGPEVKGHIRHEQTRREQAAQIQLAGSAKLRDLAANETRPGIDFKTINWERRNACRSNLKLFASTYLPNVFYLPWSKAQLKVASKLQEVIMQGGLYAIAMPRGEGKTALCRAAIIWGTAYGHIHFPFFIGSKEGKAIQTLDFIRTVWFTSKMLLADFPEIAYPVVRLENRSHAARGQHYRGNSTHIRWEAKELRYPCLILSREDASHYPESDIIPLPDYNGYLINNSGTIIRTEGIDGSIRGEADIHPYLLTQPRPDCVLLDDVQKDQKADSPSSVEKLERLIDGAVKNLSGPGQLIAGLMPCTVIQEDDISDRYLDRSRKPHWNGMRFSMVESWPEGITDEMVDNLTEAGKLWLKYDELRKKSLREHEDIHLATEHYANPEHRKIMDKDFKVSWDARYNEDKRFKGNREISAQQNAMNLRFENLYAFLAEQQNKPRKKTIGGTPILTVNQFLEDRIVKIPRLRLTPQDEILVGYIDVQDECLFYSLFASELDFTGRFIDYNTFPDFKRIYYAKSDAEKWCRLSSQYFQAFPDAKPAGYSYRSKKTPKAPFEGKIYLALWNLCDFLLSRKYLREDEVELSFRYIGIDANWGRSTDTVYRFIREYGDYRILPCHGKFIGAATLPFDAYAPKPGQLVGDLWILDSSPKARGQRHLTIDANQAKSFLMTRLATPKGNPGAVTVYEDTPEHHEIFAQHICKSEYTEAVYAKGRTVDEWQPLPDNPDNDYLDTAVGCMALASAAGARFSTDTVRSIPALQSSDAAIARQRKDGRKQTLSRIWKRKRA